MNSAYGAEIEHGILALLSLRAPGKTICPSEVARRLGGANWRHLMEPVRQAAWHLADLGQVVVLKSGRPVARDAALGPIRIALHTDCAARQGSP